VSAAAAPPPLRLPAATVGPVRIEARSYADVAKILVSMKPAEAGPILARMSDENVEGILAQLGPRPAASLLAQLPAERAAALSLRLIDRGPREKKP
jgi:flagellar motility protein MotE (MotC chaperone)